MHTLSYNYPQSISAELAILIYADVAYCQPANAELL